MDVCESHKQQRRPAAAVDTSSRRHLVPAERNGNASAAASITSRGPQAREVSSRYKSPSRPATPASPRRFPSPTPARTSPNPPSKLVPKRAISAERKRPSTPPSPSNPSTPVHDSSVDIQVPPRRLSTASRLQEGLWPSTMRSLSVSLQSDSFSVHVSKKEKPGSNVSSDRTLRPSSNVAHKPLEAPIRSRKPTPERNRSPIRGKITQDQSENARPSEGSHAKLIEQHRWPSRIGGKVSSNSLNRSVDLCDKSLRGLSTPCGKVSSNSLNRSVDLCDKSLRGLSTSSATRKSSPRRMSVLDCRIKPLQKAASEASKLSLSAEEIVGAVSKVKSADYESLGVSVPQALASTSLSVTSAIRTQSLPSPGSRPASPSKTSANKGISPSRARPSTPPSRGVSPSRIKPSSVATQSESSTSVLSFIADFKKGKKAANYIDDAHQLRLLYNRYLQWRFANARADAVMYMQKATVEKTLCNVWNATLSLWVSVVRKRINLQQLNLKLKLNAILNDQIAYLEDWDLLEEDHLNSLTGAVEDLEASTLRLPVTEGAKADVESLKISIGSAVDVMKAMGSSICSLLPGVESINGLVSELAVLAAKERAVVGHCEAFLASTAAMQVEEYSIMTHLIQVEKTAEKQHI